MKQQSLSDIEYTNRGRKTKREEVDQYKKCVEGSDEKEIERLKGMLISARQVETEIFPSIMNYLKNFNIEEISKDLLNVYRNLQHN